jgi:hypothetical protein
MLSLARSRYTLALQFTFLATNAIGVLLSTIYNASTPDLYPNNAHHKLGWIATWVVCAQVVIGLLGRVIGAFKPQTSHAKTGERQSFIPVSTEAMTEHERTDDSQSQLYRLSNDSGQGTEPKTESLRSNSLSTSADETPIPLHDVHKEYQDDDDDDLGADLPALPRDGRLHSLATKAAGMISSRVWKFLVFGYNFVDRTVLILGFITLCVGITTYGRFFVSWLDL